MKYYRVHSEDIAYLTQQPRVFIVKLNYPKLQNKNGHCCKSKLDKVAKVVYRLSGTV